MRKFMRCWILIPTCSYAQSNFEPIPPGLNSAYQFDLQKNFFASDAAYRTKLRELGKSLEMINNQLGQVPLTATKWKGVIHQYSDAEAKYRVIDLYLFLRFARDMADTTADIQSDSIRAVMRHTRSMIKQKLAELPPATVQLVIAGDQRLAYFIRSVREERNHLLSASADSILAPSMESRSSRFYDEALHKMNFRKLATSSGEIDVIRQRSAWEDSPDSVVRALGQQYVLNGYAPQKDYIGYHYIAMIKALNEYAIDKRFKGLIDEKNHEWGFSGKTLNLLFEQIIKGAKQKKTATVATQSANEDPLRFNITQATSYLENGLGVLGPAYVKELNDLLNPHNGRIDLAGNGNRMPIRGTASVYPIFPSIFYALNYEGYLIDLSLLAHEAGHAVQASLMYRNGVPLLYATGPAYFTESFGKFNELLLFDYLSLHEANPMKLAVFKQELKNRIDVLFGSSMEALIEYELVDGIVQGSITTPAQLDSVTRCAGMLITPEIFTELPDYKGLWMLLETNYRAPLHNVNDMIAAALAIKYYQLYKSDPNVFVPKYISLLSKGYVDQPDHLLKQLGIAIEDKNFIADVVKFATR